MHTHRYVNVVLDTFRLAGGPDLIAAVTIVFAALVHLVKGSFETLIFSQALFLTTFSSKFSKKRFEVLI
jgi:hypothetical protein